MPKVLRSFEFKKVSFGSNKRYDWDELLDGKIRQLDAGTDFTCKPQTMLMLARKNAAERGLSLRGSKVEGGVVLQAVPGEGAAAGGSAGNGSAKAGKGRKGAKTEEGEEGTGE